MMLKNGVALGFGVHVALEGVDVAFEGGETDGCDLADGEGVVVFELFGDFYVSGIF